MGLFLDFATSLVIWSLVCIAVALIIAAVRKSKNRIRYVQIAFLVAVVLAALSMIPSLQRAEQHADKALPTTHHAMDPFGRLSTADQARLKAIMGSVVNDSTTFTPEVHAEFWEILDRAHLTRTEEEYIRTSLADMTVTYQRLFYLDALTAIKGRQPVKSKDRALLEGRLLAAGEVSEARITANDSLIARIASGRPVPAQGGVVMFNEERIRTMIKLLSSGEGRLAALFTRP